MVRKGGKAALLSEYVTSGKFRLYLNTHNFDRLSGGNGKESSPCLHRRSIQDGGWHVCFFLQGFNKHFVELVTKSDRRLDLFFFFLDNNQALDLTPENDK